MQTLLQSLFLTLCAAFPPYDDAFDFTKVLDEVDTSKGKPAIVLREQDVHSFLITSFAFDQETSRVGEPCSGQLTVTSRASEGSVSVIMDDVKLLFETSLKPITLRHAAGSSGMEKCKDGALLSKVELKEEQSKRLSAIAAQKRGQKSTVLVGEADLTFAPGETKVFEFSIPLRESETARALSATFSMSAEAFDLDYIVSFDHYVSPGVLWTKVPIRKHIVRPDPHSIIILPKPPKMDIRFPSLSEQYYTDEAVSLELAIYNGEDEEVLAYLDVEVSSPQLSNPAVLFKVQLPAPPSLEDGTQKDEETENPANTQLGRISKSDSIKASLDLKPIKLQSVYDVALVLKYTLASDPDTRITRRQTIRLNVGSPFEANYDFSPRQDDRPWPSYFDKNTITPPPTPPSATADSPASEPQGLTQNWALTARYCSFAREPLQIESASLSQTAPSSTIICSTSLSASSPSLPTQIAPEALGSTSFDVLIQKLSLDDRRSAPLDLSLSLAWRRLDSDPSLPPNTTTLPIPRLLVASSEPRVLASYTSTPPSTTPPILHLHYTIENPSMHFLTFSAVMESSEKFAFEGPKSAMVQVLPLGRREIEYVVVPNVRGEWMGVNLVVTDRYFQKVLRVQPGEGMRVLEGGEGVGVWVPEEEGNGEKEEGGRVMEVTER